MGNIVIDVYPVLLHRTRIPNLHTLQPMRLAQVAGLPQRMCVGSTHGRANVFIP
jgi:hypothetical protein